MEKSKLFGGFEYVETNILNPAKSLLFLNIFDLNCLHGYRLGITYSCCGTMGNALGFPCCIAPYVYEGIKVVVPLSVKSQQVDYWIQLMCVVLL